MHTVGINSFSSPVGDESTAISGLLSAGTCYGVSCAGLDTLAVPVVDCGVGVALAGLTLVLPQPGASVDPTGNDDNEEEEEDEGVDRNGTTRVRHPSSLLCQQSSLGDVFAQAMSPVANKQYGTRNRGRHAGLPKSRQDSYPCGAVSSVARGVKRALPATEDSACIYDEDGSEFPRSGTTTLPGVSETDLQVLLVCSSRVDQHSESFFFVAAIRCHSGHSIGSEATDSPASARRRGVQSRQPRESYDLANLEHASFTTRVHRE